MLALDSLISMATKSELYAIALEIAEGVGVEVTAWQTGNPTRSLYHFLSEVLSRVEDIVVKYIKAGFLDYATGEWLILRAYDVYRVVAIEATFATMTGTLTNTGGSLFEIESAGDVTVKCTATEKTYHNTSTGTLSPLGTLELDFVADESGSDSSAEVGEIDDLVTTMLAVTFANTTAAVGLDLESDDSIRERCRAKLGALSPNGPADAYDYVARTPELGGSTEVTRTRIVKATGTGEVTGYLAGPSGGVSGSVVTQVQTAWDRWAVPDCVTATPEAASNVTVPVTYELWIYSTVSQSESAVQDAVAAALETMFAARPVGGDVIEPDPGALYHSLIEATIKAAFPGDVFRVDVTVPAGNTVLDIGEVAVLGSINPTVNFVEAA